MLVKQSTKKHPAGYQCPVRNNASLRPWANSMKSISATKQHCGTLRERKLRLGNLQEKKTCRHREKPQYRGRVALVRMGSIRGIASRGQMRTLKEIVLWKKSYAKANVCGTQT